MLIVWFPVAENSDIAVALFCSLYIVIFFNCTRNYFDRKNYKNKLSGKLSIDVQMLRLLHQKICTETKVVSKFSTLKGVR